MRLAFPAAPLVLSPVEHYLRNAYNIQQVYLIRSIFMSVAVRLG